MASGPGSRSLVFCSAARPDAPPAAVAEKKAHGAAPRGTDRGATRTRRNAGRLQPQPGRQPGGHRRLPQEDINHVRYDLEMGDRPEGDRPAHIATAMTAQDLNSNWKQCLFLVWPSGSGQFAAFFPRHPCSFSSA